MARSRSGCSGILARVSPFQGARSDVSIRPGKGSTQERWSRRKLWILGVSRNDTSFNRHREARASGARTRGDPRAGELVAGSRANSSIGDQDQEGRRIKIGWWRNVGERSGTGHANRSAAMVREVKELAAAKRSPRSDDGNPELNVRVATGARHLHPSDNTPTTSERARQRETD